MTFEVEFSNIMPRSVDVSIVPSTDEQYTAVMMYAKNLPATPEMNGMWKEQKKSLIITFLATANTTKKMKHFTSLTMAMVGVIPLQRSTSSAKIAPSGEEMPLGVVRCETT